MTTAEGISLDTALDTALWRRPLGSLSPLDRALVRAVGFWAARRVLSIQGAEHIASTRDPFILVANHSTRLEALMLPAVLMLLRGGRPVHFLADWNFLLVPGIALLFRTARVIIVPNKDARPRFLNKLKPMLVGSEPPMDAARQRLAAGAPLGIFPEGTANRNRLRLLRGRLGAAQLSLATGVPIVPMGLRFPTAPADGPIPEGSPMVIDIGPAMLPPANGGATALRDWHLAIMGAIAARSHKIFERDEERHA